jgi:hypothetical protein
MLAFIDTIFYCSKGGAMGAVWITVSFLANHYISNLFLPTVNALHAIHNTTVIFL